MESASSSALFREDTRDDRFGNDCTDLSRPFSPYRRCGRRWLLKNERREEREPSQTKSLGSSRSPASWHPPQPREPACSKTISRRRSSFADSTGEVRVEVAEVPRSSRKEGRRPYSTLLSRPGQVENEARAQPALTEQAYCLAPFFTSPDARGGVGRCPPLRVTLNFNP